MQDVAVVVPTYNRSEYLAEAVGSLLSQTVRPGRVLVIDDGSTDATPEVAKSFGDRIEYRRKPNGGKSSALNAALPGLGAEFVWIFDDDDVAEPYALERMLDALRASPEAGFAYGSYMVFETGPDGGRRLIDPSFPSVRPEEVFVASLGRSFIHQPGLLVRGRCYEEVGGFDETLVRSQDYEMMLRLARRFRGAEAPGPLFLQRRHAGLRGSASFAVRPAEVEAAWTRFDQAIIRRYHAAADLAEYVPGRPAGAPLSDDDRLSALLRRCTILARKGVWDLAEADLAEAVSLAGARGVRRLTPEQSVILRPMFDVFSGGAASFESADGFRLQLGRIASRPLARDVRSAMAWGLPYRLRLAAEKRAWRELRMLLQVYARIASPGIVVGDGARKIAGKLAGRLGPRAA